MLQREKLDSILTRYHVLQDEMVANPDPETYVKLASEYSTLEPVIERIKELDSIQNDLDGILELLSDNTTDKEMVE